MLLNVTSSLRGWHDVVVSRVEEITTAAGGTLLRVHLSGDDLPFSPWFQINPEHTHFSSEFFEALELSGEVDSDNFVDASLSVNLEQVVTEAGRKIWGVVGFRALGGEQAEMVDVDL